jgi:hypothetical protein
MGADTETKRRPSPQAAQELMEAVEGGESTDDYEGRTDCPDGCFVEPDGRCPHGFESAMLTLGVI